MYIADIFGSHIDAAEQQRALNSKLVFKRQAFLSNFSCLQLIQNSAPSVGRRRQCDIRIAWNALLNLIVNEKLTLRAETEI